MRCASLMQRAASKLPSGAAIRRMSPGASVISSFSARAFWAACASMSDETSIPVARSPKRA